MLWDVVMVTGGSPEGGDSRASLLPAGGAQERYGGLG